MSKTLSTRSRVSYMVSYFLFLADRERQKCNQLTCEQHNFKPYGGGERKAGDKERGGLHRGMPNQLERVQEGDRLIETGDLAHGQPPLNRER